MTIKTMDQLKFSMSETLKAFQKNLTGLRTGRASPSLVEPVMVEAYGGRMPLAQLSTISAPEARLIVVQVWDATLVGAVDKAIQASGLNPIVEGVALRIPLPDLSQQRRQELVKMAKTYTEEAKIGLRNCRRIALDQLDKDLPEDILHTVKKDIQKITDEFIQQAVTLLEEKEKEILKI